MRPCLIILGLFNVLASIGHMAEDPKPFVPTGNYTTTNLVGWTVRVNKRLLAEERTPGSNALQLLASKLREITNSLPQRAREKLRAVPIWLGVDDGHAPCSEYHPSKQWLTEHGFNPDKARCVEIGNARRFIDWSRSQPSMVLHELAHAYHHQVLGFDYPPIKKAFESAVQSGIYDKVKRENGKTVRAYALNDPQEYFAEGTEAFFGRNDFYPFTRDELKQHDPALFSILEEVWNR